MSSRTNYRPPGVPADGPRPKETRRDGITRCESLEEMNVRLSHLRKRGDYRSADRILASQDDTWRRARKALKRFNGGGQE